MSNPASAYPKRLIEVDLPIERISAHARREKSIRHGHISTLHIWWARRPLAACRAVICAALWPDPADPLCPAAFRETARKLMMDVGGRPGQAPRGRELPAIPPESQADSEAAGRQPQRCARRCSTSSPTSPIGTTPPSPNTSTPAARSPRPRTRRWAVRPAPGRSSWTRLPAAAPFRSKPCAWARTPLPATSIPCPSCSTRSSSNTSPNTASASPMKSANGASGSSAKPKRNWPSSIPRTRTARRPSPISGRGRFNAKAPAAARKCRSSAPSGSPRKPTVPWPCNSCRIQSQARGLPNHRQAARRLGGSGRIPKSKSTTRNSTAQ